MLYVIEDIGLRQYQEDRHCVKLDLYNDYEYISIFDGHGGSDVSDFLKFHLKDYVIKHLKLDKHPKNALYDAFMDANQSMPIHISYITGSAAIVILKKKNEIWVANSGDSRAIMISNNKAISLTNDHKPNREDELKRIEQLGGYVSFNDNDVPRVQGNLALSRSLGDKYLYPFVICEPEIKHFNITEYTKYIVLATDGLWDVLNNVEVKNIILNIMKNNKNKKILAHDCIHELLNSCRKKNSTDNTTIILWML